MIGLLTPLQIDPFSSFLAVACALALAALVVFIFVAIWLYRDAESRRMSGGLWVVVLLLASLFFSFVGGIVVLVVYLLVRGSHPVGGMPGYYGYPYPPAYAPAYPPPMAPPPAATYTPPPAAPATPPSNCARCGAPLEPRAMYCPNCGAKV